MCKKLICLIFLMSISGIAQAVEWDRAAYWDSRYPTHWVADADTIIVRDALATAGYAVLDADQLKTWMDGHIADGELSVVVICKDVFPDTVVETMSDTCTTRRYLDTGGKIVFYGDIPFYNYGNPDGTETGWGDAGAPAILGFDTSPGGIRGTNNTVQFTPAGIEWGLTDPWQSIRPAAAGVPPDLTVLATDNAGNSPGWVKHYLQGDNYRGFVRIWDEGPIRSTDDLIRVAEYIPMKAASPTPADGTSVGPTADELGNVYLMLDYTPGATAIEHRGYFADNYDDVANRESTAYLGTPTHP